MFDLYFWILPLACGSCSLLVLFRLSVQFLLFFFSSCFFSSYFIWIWIIFSLLLSTIFLWMICTHFLHYSFSLIYVSITTALPTFFLFLFRWIRIRPHSFIFGLYWRLLTPSSVAWRFFLTVVIPFFIVLGGSPLCYPQVYSVLSGVEVLFFDGCHTVLYRLGWISAVLSPSFLRPLWRQDFIPPVLALMFW